MCHSEGWQPDAGAPASRFTFAPVSPFSPFTLLVYTVCVSVSMQVNKQIDLWICRSTGERQQVFVGNFAQLFVIACVSNGLIAK